MKFNPNFTKRENRFHIVFTLKYFKYMLIFSVATFIRALFHFTLSSFIEACIISGFLFVSCFFVAFIIWAFTSISIKQNELRVKKGCFYKIERIYKKDSIAAINIERPLLYRIIGASILTIYFKNNFYPRKIKFYLSKNKAAQIINTLTPVQEKNAVFEPTGAERAVLVILSANLLSTAAFILITLDYISDFLGQSRYDLALIARDNLLTIDTIVQRFVPAGISLLLSLGFLLASLTVLLSFFRTARLRVCRAGGIILCRGGLFTKTERRININCIVACDVKTTPVARLMGRKALYITAGSFVSRDFPVLVFKKSQPEKPSVLLPEFSLPSDIMCEYKRKSKIQYLYKPLLALAVCLFIFYVFYIINSPIMFFMPVLIALCIMSFAVSVEGIFKEGFCINKNRTISLCYTKYITRHEVCVITHNMKYSVRQSPFNIRKKSANLKINVLYGLKLRARGVIAEKALEMPFFV